MEQAFPELVDKFEVARLLNVHPRTIHQWRKEGLPFIKISPVIVRFDLEKVREWVLKRTAEEMEKKGGRTGD